MGLLQEPRKQHRLSGACVGQGATTLSRGSGYGPSVHLFHISRQCVGAAFSQLLTSSKLRGGAIGRKILGSEPGISVLTVPSNDFSFL